jgi:hypothetical protein
MVVAPVVDDNNPNSNFVSKDLVIGSTVFFNVYIGDFSFAYTTSIGVVAFPTFDGSGSGSASQDPNDPFAIFRYPRIAQNAESVTFTGTALSAITSAQVMPGGTCSTLKKNDTSLTCVFSSDRLRSVVPGTVVYLRPTIQDYPDLGFQSSLFVVVSRTIGCFATVPRYLLILHPFQLPSSTLADWLSRLGPPKSPSRVLALTIVQLETRTRRLSSSTTTHSRIAPSHRARKAA